MDVSWGGGSSPFGGEPTISRGGEGAIANSLGVLSGRKRNNRAEEKENRG